MAGKVETQGGYERTRLVLVTSACRVSQLQEVVDGADYRPIEAAQQELAEASGMFDLH